MNTSPSTNTARLQSLDLMRGLIMVLLAFEAAELYAHLLNITTPGTWEHSLMRQFFHNDWEGLHFWDLVQPAFMLMAGVAMAYSLTAQTRRGVPWSSRLRKILTSFKGQNPSIRPLLRWQFSQRNGASASSFIARTSSSNYNLFRFFSVNLHL